MAELNTYPRPDRMRRQMAMAMANQWDRPTVQDGALQQRGNVIPLGVYDGGVGPAVPEMLNGPRQAIARLMARGYQPGNEQAIQDAAEVAGTLGSGTLAARGVAGAEGAGIFGGWLKRGPKSAERIAALQQEVAALEKQGASIPQFHRFLLNREMGGADEVRKLDLLTRYRDVLNERLPDALAAKQAEREANLEKFRQSLQPDTTPALAYDPRGDKGVSAEADPTTARMRFEQQRQVRDMMADDPAYRQKLYEEDPAYAYSKDLPGAQFDRNVDQMMQRSLGQFGNQVWGGEGVMPTDLQRIYTREVPGTLQAHVDSGLWGEAGIEDLMRAMARRGYALNNTRRVDYQYTGSPGNPGFQPMSEEQKRFVNAAWNDTDIESALAKFIQMRGQDGR